MNKLRYSTITFLLVTFLYFSGCKKEASETSCEATSLEKEVFFSLKKYFCQLVNEYDSKKLKVNKKVTFGNRTEIIEDLDINWKTEFEIFIATDINHSAWYKKFTIDTIPITDGYKVLYLSKLASIPTKEIEISFDNDHTVTKITTKSSRKNLIYKSKQSLSFEPDIGYHVEVRQRTLFLSKTEFTVDGSIIQTN